VRPRRLIGRTGAPRDPVDIAGPRRPGHVVVRLLNFTVRRHAVHWVLTALVVLLLLSLRWAAVSRRRRRSHTASLEQGSVGDLRRAASLEARDWLVTGLGILVAFILVYLFVSYVGPFKPVHEWFQK